MDGAEKMVWEDPIVKEIRKWREEYAAEFEFDVDAIFEDIQRRQAESKRKQVSFPPRKPRTDSNAA